MNIERVFEDMPILEKYRSFLNVEKDSIKNSVNTVIFNELDSLHLIGVLAKNAFRDLVNKNILENRLLIYRIIESYENKKSLLIQLNIDDPKIIGKTIASLQDAIHMHNTLLEIKETFK